MASTCDHGSGKIPRLSIGLPVYNGALFLRESIDSLLAQTFDDFELIISDNASTDETEAICRDYAERDRRVRYVRQPHNIGAVPNFNRVFELAGGEYFKWAAHDDVCRPTFLQRCVEALDADPWLAWCHSRTTHIDVRGEPLEADHLRQVSYVETKDGAVRTSRGSQHPHQRLLAVMLGKGGCCDSYGLFRSEVIRKTKLILPYYGAEQVFIAEVGLWGRFAEIPETLFCMRIHGDCAGLMESAVEQQDYICPQLAGRRRLVRLRLLQGYLSAIFRANLGPAERMRCLLVVGRYLLQFNKWKKVIRQAMRGAGLSGDNRSIVRRTNGSQRTQQTH